MEEEEQYGEAEVDGDGEYGDVEEHAAESPAGVLSAEF